MERNVYVMSERTAIENYQLSMSLIVPRPIAWVATYNENGRANLAPYALFSAVCTEPMMLQFTSRWPKDSCKNAEREGAFTIHVAQVEQQPQVAFTSGEFDATVSEADEAELFWREGSHVHAPLIDAAHVAFECETHSQVHIENSVMTIGVVKAIHVDKKIMSEDGMADFAKLNPLSKLGRNQWGQTTAFV